MTLRDLQLLIESRLNEQEDKEKCRDYIVYIDLAYSKLCSNTRVYFDHEDEAIDIY